MTITYNHLHARRGKPPSISKGMLCHHKKRLANESHSDHKFSTFCTNCSCILFIFKKQRDKSKQFWQHLSSWQVNFLTMGYHIQMNPWMKESCSFPLFPMMWKACMANLHFTAITLTRSQLWGGFRRVKYITHPLSRSEDVVKILTKKEGRSNTYVGNRLEQFFCSI